MSKLDYIFFSCVFVMGVCLGMAIGMGIKATRELLAAWARRAAK